MLAQEVRSDENFAARNEGRVGNHYPAVKGEVDRVTVFLDFLIASEDGEDATLKTRLDRRAESLR